MLHTPAGVEHDGVTAGLQPAKSKHACRRSMWKVETIPVENTIQVKENHLVRPPRMPWRRNVISKEPVHLADEEITGRDPGAFRTSPLLVRTGVRQFVLGGLLRDATANELEQDETIANIRIAAKLLVFADESRLRFFVQTQFKNGGRQVIGRIDHIESRVAKPVVLVVDLTHTLRRANPFFGPHSGVDESGRPGNMLAQGAS